MDKKAMDAIVQVSKRNDARNKKIADKGIEWIRVNSNSKTSESSKGPVFNQDAWKLMLMSDDSITSECVEKCILKEYNYSGLKAQKAKLIKMQHRREPLSQNSIDKADSVNIAVGQRMPMPSWKYEPVDQIVRVISQMVEEFKYVDAAFWRFEQIDSEAASHISSDLFSFHSLYEIVMLELHYRLRFSKKYVEGDYETFRAKVECLYSDLLDQQGKKFDEATLYDEVMNFTNNTMECFPKGVVFPDPNPEEGQGIARVFFDEFYKVLQFLVAKSSENKALRNVYKKNYGDKYDRYIDFRNEIYQVINDSEYKNLNCYCVEKYWKFESFREMVKYIEKSSIAFIKSEVAFLDFIHDIPLKRVRESMYKEHFRVTRLENKHTSVKARIAYQFRAKVILFYITLPEVIIDFLMDLFTDVNYPIDEIDHDYLEKSNIIQQYTDDLVIEKEQMKGSKRLFSAISLCNSQPNENIYDTHLEVTSEDLGLDIEKVIREMKCESNGSKETADSKETSERLSYRTTHAAVEPLNLKRIENNFRELLREYDEIYEANLFKCFEKRDIRSK